MDKQKMTVKLAGRSFSLLTSESPAYIQRVAAYTDRKLEEILHSTNLTTEQAAIMTCMNLCDELMKSQDENTMLRKRMEAMIQDKEQ